MTLMGWATHVLQWWSQREAMVRIGGILKNHRSSDCSLQFENMKMESLVIVDQHATVNLYLSLVLTARHALEVEWIGSILCFITKSVFFSLFNNKSESPCLPLKGNIRPIY